MTPEAQARQQIDQKLEHAGWVIQDMKQLNLAAGSGVAVREYGKRILGYDNAHAVRPPKKFKYAGRRLSFDHKHRHVSDKGVPYEFESAYQLLEDFFKDEDRALQEMRRS